VNLEKVSLGILEEIARNQGFHPMMEGVVRAVLTNRSISDEDKSERAEWRDLLRDGLFRRLRLILFPMVQSIPQNIVQIMEAVAVDFTILGGTEWCCEFPLIGAGLPYKMEELIRHNLEKVQALGTKKVVLHNLLADEIGRSSTIRI
jgi:hypothetical protein